MSVAATQDRPITCIAPLPAAPPAAPVIRLEQVTKSFRRGATVTAVLRGVDLEVHRGECVFLVGPSGCGKSTLLSILGCLLAPDRGRMWILGEPISHAAQQAMRRRSIGFVFQNFRLIRGLTAIDNICVPLMIADASPAAARRRAGALLHEVGLADRGRDRVDALSAGQCQRVALARALAGDPDVILADEPTAALDAATGRQIMDLLRRLIASHGKTAVIVTHDPRILGYADRVYRLQDGRAVETVRTAADLLEP